MDDNNSNFVNRLAELEQLSSYFPPVSPKASCVFLVSPSGLGKSSLTNKLVSQFTDELFKTVIVDPNIRDKAETSAVFGGYFIQKCAQEISKVDKESFSLFLKRRRWQTAQDKKISDIIRNYPSIKSIYSFAADYVERVFSSGEYSPESQLASSDELAITVCKEYVTYYAQIFPTIFIIREAQHLDGESLDFFFKLKNEFDNCSLMFEYTSESYSFSSDHQKIILRNLQTISNAHIFELLQLNKEHLEHVLRRNLNGDYSISSEYYLRWDGNLRTISELKYRIGIGKPLINSKDFILELPDLTTQLKDHINQLNRNQKLILVCLDVHQEPINNDLLNKVFISNNLNLLDDDFEESVNLLNQLHKFVLIENEHISLENEDISGAIRDIFGSVGLRVMALTYLRDAYIEKIRDKDFLLIPLSTCIRKVFKFCSLTNDASGLLSIINSLSEQIVNSNDQTIFVDIVVESIIPSKQLFAEDKFELLSWAAKTAYKIGDFESVVLILNDFWRESLELTLLYLFSLMDIGKHDDLETDLIEAKKLWNSAEANAYLTLINGIFNRTTNHKDSAHQLFVDISNSKFPIPRGFALRFLETVTEFPSATRSALESAEVFKSCGVPHSEAFSRLASAMHLSRSGCAEDAIIQINLADNLLANVVREVHTSLNNRAASLLLGDTPNFNDCIKFLRLAFAKMKDDYSETVILTNLAITYWQSGNIQKACDSISSALLILEEPDFNDKDIYWGVNFNAFHIYNACKLYEKAQICFSYAKKVNSVPIIYPEYWKFRFDLQSTPPSKKFNHMLSKNYHPLFLSHWQVECEAMSELN
jgi:tetratricopeptide (TPR) repeat protein